MLKKIKTFFPHLFISIIGVFRMFLTIDFSTFQDILKINNLSAVVLIEKDIQIIEISINELKEDVSN